MQFPLPITHYPLPKNRAFHHKYERAETIVLYKLPLISRQELARMFSLSDLKRTRYYQEVRQQEALELIRRLLLRRIGAVNSQLQERIEQLSVNQLEDLAEALLDFSNEANLAAWLHENSNQSDEQ